MHRGGDDTGEVVRVRCAEVPATLPTDTIARWIGMLPEPRASMLAARLEKKNGLDSLTALALLAGVLASCELPPLMRLAWTERGKPQFDGGPGVSISHSRGTAACAVAPRGLEVGIDLEPADRAHAASVAQIANESERAALAKGSFSPTALWTAKEAVLKAAGAGLAEIRGVVIGRHHARFAGLEYQWRLFRPRRGLLLTVASPSPLPPVEIAWPARSAVFG